MSFSTSPLVIVGCTCGKPLDVVACNYEPSNRLTVIKVKTHKCENTDAELERQLEVAKKKLELAKQEHEQYQKASRDLIKFIKEEQNGSTS